MLFFHKIAPPGPNRGTYGTLGRIRIFQNIRGDIRQIVGFAVYHEYESKNYSKCTPFNQLREVTYTAETISHSNISKNIQQK